MDSKGPASYFPSIEKKYGCPISYWVELINADPELTRHGELVAWLKQEHGHGHGLGHRPRRPRPAQPLLTPQRPEPARSTGRCRRPSGHATSVVAALPRSALIGP